VGLNDRAAAFRRTVGERRVILFHCASAGELEALKPLAREFDRERTALVVSYFSPSARSALASSSEFDFADYSPIDVRSRVEPYLDAIHPDVIAITKHDVWPNFAWSARRRGIPLFLINGNFHARSLRLWPCARRFHAAVYEAFTAMLAVSEEDAANARRIVGTRVPVEVAGDSRFDRVLARAQEAAPISARVEELCAGRAVIVAGSTHPEDEELLLPALRALKSRWPNVLTLVVPHDPSRRAARRAMSVCVLNGLSAADSERLPSDRRCDVLLINRTGVLADLYRLGRIAFVGGAFGKGVHSVLEPMARGLPVLCGPNIVVSHEARTAQSEGLLEIMTSRRQLAEKLEQWLASPSELDELGRRSREFVQARAGASARIAARLKEALRGGVAI